MEFTAKFKLKFFKLCLSYVIYVCVFIDKVLREIL